MSSLAPGATVWITDTAGTERRGQVISSSAESVTTTAGEERRRYNLVDIERIRVRTRDPLLNGALIGAGSAVASGLLLCRLSEPWRNCRDDVGPMFRMGAIGTGIGIGIDALIRERRTVYDRGERGVQLRVMPIFSRHKKGVRLSVRF